MSWKLKIVQLLTQGDKLEGRDILVFVQTSQNERFDGYELSEYKTQSASPNQPNQCLLG